MPTGAGKSLCFQVPALMLEGITIVISPLISLMRDQVQALIASGVSAAFINSSLNYNQTLKALENAKAGKYKIIYVAPERLETPEFHSFAMNARIAMVTVDEAHCVSQWGQNFRPSYLKIRDFINELAERPIVAAFTATATKEVKQDIENLLSLHNPFVMATGFNRENLYFEVQKPTDKYKAVIQYLQNNPNRSGIIYCSTRKAVEEVYERLSNDQYEATQYHAGLSENERTKNQDDFLYDRKTIMVATNAFGMGIDKSNVSFVIHYNMPKNIESYYQEAGRAGRDGTAADCILLYGGQDVITNQFLIDQNNENNELDSAFADQIKEKERERLKQMTYYCHTFNCLREYILKYFGEYTHSSCGNCSSCNTNYEEVDIVEDAQKILSCIIRMGERYGVKMVIDTLRGSKAAKIIRLGLDDIKSYGIMAHAKEHEIRDVINHLVLNEYILLTNDEFPVAKVTTKGKEWLLNGGKLTMKAVKKDLSKEDAKAPYSKILSKQKVQINQALFQKLRDLRYQLAQQQNVPAFVVFTDATLVDMCQKLPTNDSEFLDVSGVGDKKLEAYGQAFMEVIRDYQQDEGVSDHGNSDINTDAVSIIEVSDYVKSEFEISEEPLPISLITDRINALLLQKTDKKVVAAKVQDYLIELGYLQLETLNEKNFKVATEKGERIGISSLQKTKQNGEIYKQNFYNCTAQKMIIEQVEAVIEYAQKMSNRK
ncbi:ATP-dependent DNA helicase RecQ [Desulfuribacillus alkaliarsenatis]|uniref:DNA helicase RecQ n=2 Tax=Desulfuribacillus alkaliarsenatis TaxID=766136 RepID=A0A1E5G2T0_9FIRM|nr:ATP-dependent DNA helicase RecQ [Desulfuribacillus alkaliarsenatis]